VGVNARSDGSGAAKRVEEFTWVIPEADPPSPRGGDEAAILSVRSATCHLADHVSCKMTIPLSLLVSRNTRLRALPRAILIATTATGVERWLHDVAAD